MDSYSGLKATPEFYLLSDPLSNSAFRGHTGDLEIYRQMEVAARGEGQVRQTPVIRHQMGRRLCDFIWVSLVPIIHQRVVDLLTLGGVTGWATYPVQVFDRLGVPVPGYHGLSITGRCESISVDPARAEVVYEDLPGGRFPHYKGLSITTDSWDGSDIFTAADGKTSFLIVTAKVRDLFVRSGITNVVLQPISEFVDPETAKDLPSFPKVAAQGGGPDRPQ